MNRPLGVVGGLFGGLAVAAGAFGAHALRGHLSPDLLSGLRDGGPVSDVPRAGAPRGGSPPGSATVAGSSGRRLVLCRRDRGLLGEPLSPGPDGCRLVGRGHTAGWRRAHRRVGSGRLRAMAELTPRGRRILLAAVLLYAVVTIPLSVHKGEDIASEFAQSDLLLRGLPVYGAPQNQGVWWPPFALAAIAPFALIARPHRPWPRAAGQRSRSCVSPGACGARAPVRRMGHDVRAPRGGPADSVQLPAPSPTSTRLSSRWPSPPPMTSRPTSHVPAPGPRSPPRSSSSRASSFCCSCSAGNGRRLASPRLVRCS